MSLNALRLVRFSARGLIRDLRAPDVRALFVALALAVAASTMIGFFLDRLDRGLTRQASQLLGGDLVLEQARPFSSELRDTLEEAGLVLSDQVGMVSMVSLGDAFQPASLKAVDQRYPLYGSAEVDLGEGSEVVAWGPEPGEAWLAPRLALLLEAEIGDRVRVGELELNVAGLIQREPDQSGGFANFNPRLMLHMDDLAATQLVQDGSRVAHELLAAGPPDIIDDLAPLLDRLRRDGVEVRDVRRDRPQLGNALERADRYLSLAGLAAVLLAGVAVAMATRRYVDRHLDTAALMRCFGATQGELTRLFSLQLLWLALAASAVGALLGLAGQAALLALLMVVLPMELPSPGALPLWLGVLTALAVLAGFAGPTLLRLKRVSALKVLRRELDPLPVSAWLVVVFASLVFGSLLWLYSGDLGLSVGLLLGGLVMLLLLWGLGSLLLKVLLAGLLRLPRRGGDDLTQALRRRRTASLGQLLAFSVPVFAMAMIAMVRGDLLTTWQAQLPDDTPNYCAITIQPGERDAFSSALEANADDRSSLYPMVRGRPTEINGEPAREAVPAESRGDNSLRRELNLTWQAELPEGNRIVAGEWFDAWEADVPEVSASNGWLGEVDAETVDAETHAGAVPISVEEGLAERLGLSLGDRVAFAIGSEEVIGELTSLRNLDWDSFRPNFFVIFPPGVLERFGHSYITAFHLDSDEGEALRQLVQRFPAVTLLNVDAILAQVREIVTQVTRAVELVLAFVLLAGVSVLYAALTASRPARAHESGLLRVFGAGNRMLFRIQGAEFAILGFASGLMGALLAELSTAGIYMLWLELTPRLHPWLWVVLPLGGALLIGAIGHALSRSLRKQAPAASLGLLGES